MSTSAPLSGSERQIADALGVDRSVIARLVKAHRIPAAGRAGRHATYFVRDLAARLREQDPGRMSAFERKAHFQGLRDQLRFEKEAGRLCPVEEVERLFAGQTKLFAQMVETLPGILERDAGISGVAAMRVERVVDAFRVELHRQLLALDEKPSESSSAA